MKEDCPQLALLQLNPVQPMKTAVDTFEDNWIRTQGFLFGYFIFSFQWNLAVVRK